MRFVLISLLSLAALLFSGCMTVHNNHRTPLELAQHLVNSGIKVDQAQRLSPDPLRANDALAIMIDGEEIAVYKYNLDTKVQAERLEKIKGEGRAYLIGIPFPIMVQGSFLIMGLEKHPRKKELIEAIKTFE